MNRNSMVFALAAAVLLAVGAHAQDQAAPSSDEAAPQAAPAPAAEAVPAPAAEAAPTHAKKAKEGKKAAWEEGVKADCSAEIAEGGVCAGKDFDSGLEKCLHMNRKKLSNGCKAAVRPHRKSMKSKKAAEKAPDAAPAETPAAAPAAPAEAPATAPQE